MSLTTAQILSLTGVLLPFLASLAAYLYKRFVPASKQEQFAHAAQVASSVVQAVEQACAAMSGPDKKAEATRLINQLLAQAGIKVDPTLVEVLIEQMVLALNQMQSPTRELPAVKNS